MYATTVKTFLLDEWYMMDHAQALQSGRSDILNIFERTLHAALKMRKLVCKQLYSNKSCF